MKKRVRNVAAAIVVNTQNKILIMKRSNNKKIHPNLWGLPAGGVKTNEKLKQAIKREIVEETSLKVEILKKGPTINVPVKYGEDKITFFLAKSGRSSVKLNDEHSEYKWVTIKDTLKYKFGINRSEVKKVLQKFNLL